MEQRQFLVSELLPCGKANALDIDSLLRMTGFQSVRELQEQIARERKAGAPICSGNRRGYWLPESRAEAEKFYLSMRRRAISTLAACRGARLYLEDVEGQVEMDVEQGKG